MPETLQQSDEKRLLGYLKRAVAYVDDQGLSPDEAVEKIATADQLGPGMIDLVCRAYNNGRQLGQWRTGGSILDKLASFQLADAEKVIARIYPAQADTPAEAFAKTAFDKDYLLPPSWAVDPDRRSLLRTDLAATIKEATDKCSFCRQSPCVCPSDKQANYPGCGMHKKKKKKRAEDAALSSPPEDRLRKAYGLQARAKVAHEEARRHVFVQERQLLHKMAELVDYFRQPSYLRLPFAQVDYASRRYLGEAASELLKFAYERAGLREPKAMSDAQLLDCRKIPAVYKQACDRQAAPYSLLTEALQCGFEVNQARHWVKEAEALQARVVEDVLRPFGLPSSRATAHSRSSFGNLLDGALNKTATGLTLNPIQLGIEAGVIGAGDVMGGGYLHKKQKSEESDANQSYDDLLGEDRAEALREIARQEAALHHHKKKKASFQSLIPVQTSEKQGILGATFGSAVGSGLSRGLGDMPKTKGDMINADWLELEDPAHLNEMRKIRVNSMLASLLTDPDDPISGHDPHKVLRAYNEIAATAPRVADNPATLKPLLRKRLAGHTEPFEAKEMVDIEKGLRDIKNVPPSTAHFTEAPDELLG